MSIRFERIVLENWLVFRGRVEIDFGDTAPEGKNVIVVHGLNGFGKTSFLRGVQWAFHERLKGKSLQECFNKAAISEGEKSFAVEVHFWVEDMPYQLIRRAKVTLDGAGSVSAVKPNPPELIENGRALEGAVQDKIEQILPKECQQFFFFDGLEIETYARKQRPSDIEEAVERVLGIPEVRNLRDDLKKVVERWEDERNRFLEKKGDHPRLLGELEDLQEEKEWLREELKEERQNRDALEQQKGELEKRAQALKSIEAEQEYMKKLEILKSSKENSLVEQESKLDEAIQSSPLYLLLPLLRQQKARFETESGITDHRAARETVLRARKEFLEELLDTTNCVCDRELTSPVISALENKIEELGQRLARQSIRDRRTASLAERQSALAQLIGRVTAGPIDVKKTFQLKQRLEIEIQEITQDIADLKEKLDEHEDGEVRAVYQQLGEKGSELKSTNERIKDKEGRLRDKADLIEKKNREVNQLALDNSELSSLRRSLGLAMQSKKAVGALVNLLLAKKRKTIVDNINTVFRSITNKKDEYDRVELMDDFGVCVITKSGRLLPDDDLSAGEKEVLAFAFIAGLSLSTEHAAPLLMDTPFGHLDNRHRQGLLDALPELPNQVILLATDRDLPDMDMPRLRSALQSHFRLVRDQDAETSTIEKDV